MTITPKQAADDCMARARALLGNAGILGTPQPLADDLCRVALVMGMASIDTYMHAVVLRRVSSNREALPNVLRKLKVSFGDLADLANSVVAARSNGRDSRPWVRAKNVLHERLLRMPLQSSSAVGDAMAMGGLTSGWTKISKHLAMTAEDAKQRLDRVHHHRNRIVHEGDLRRLVRPQTIERNTVSVTEVLAELDWIDTFLSALAIELP